MKRQFRCAPRNVFKILILKLPENKEQKADITLIVDGIQTTQDEMMRDKLGIASFHRMTCVVPCHVLALHHTNHQDIKDRTLEGELFRPL